LATIHRLIRTFAAESEIELLAEDGFARAGKHVVECGEVHVGAAHNGNQRWLGHRYSFSFCSAVRALTRIDSIFPALKI
jgi:hypothetical protein